MAAKERPHPLAPLFWSQIVLAYALPIGLALAYRWRGDGIARLPGTRAFCAIYPFAMVALAAILVMADAARICDCVASGAKRLPGVIVGALYAIPACVTYLLVQSGLQNIAIAWSDYVVDGSVAGFNVLLLLLVIEIFAATFLVCEIVALARRWRGLARPEPGEAHAAPQTAEDERKAAE